jgi:glycosyltransferase involved in cell wall biosynthesis
MLSYCWRGSEPPPPECFLMKIAVWHNLPSGGGKRALYDHVRGLLRHGHTIEAWCPPTADTKFLPLSGLVREHVVALEWPAPKRISDKWQITLEAARLLAAMDAHCRTCAEQMAAGGFDILFANSCMLLRTTSIGRFSTLPSVLYLQEPYRRLYEALPRLPWLAPPRMGVTAAGLKACFLDWRDVRNKRLQAREEVNNAAAFDRVLVNSYFSRESLLRAYGLDSDVCYLGIDTCHFVPQHLPPEDYAVGLGSIIPEKNLHFCIEAVAKTSAPHPKLVWIGNVADPPYLQRMQALAVARGVVFEPKVGIPDHEVLDILGRATVMLYAPRLEPFGLAPLEANACGVPVLAVAEGGVRETIVDQVNGLLVDSHPAAMAAAIQRLRDDPAFARRLGASGREAVETKWGLEQATRRLEQHLLRFARAPDR